MKTMLRVIDPQPILADAKPPGRWIWGPKAPIRDFRYEGSTLVERGTWTLSWWNIDGCNVHELLEDKDLCPVDRPEKSKVSMLFDGERWVWHITYTEAQERKWTKQKAQPGLFAKGRVAP